MRRNWSWRVHVFVAGDGVVRCGRKEREAMTTVTQAAKPNRNGRNAPRFGIRHKRDVAPKVWKCKYCGGPVPAHHTYCSMICQIAEFHRAYCEAQS